MERPAEAEIVALSSNHSDGRAAPAAPIAAASTAIASGSINLLRRRGREALGVTAVLGSATAVATMMGVTLGPLW
jgi:hypothetical protein